MAYALRVAKTKILITLPASLEKALVAAKQVGIPPSHILLLQGRADGFHSIQDLIELGAKLPSGSAYRIPPGTTNKELCGYLNFSSGTTGLPKAVGTPGDFQHPGRTECIETGHALASQYHSTVHHHGKTSGRF